MEQYKKDFIEFLVKADVLRFGDFTLKSGRKCPYFLNFGNVVSGEFIGKLGKFYASSVRSYDIGFDVLFGPAYKGIPISVATSIAFFSEFNVDIKYAYNRKEAKDHGEGGKLVGAKINAGDDVLILDDVMTAGTALRESLDILRNEVGDVNVSGVLIAVDRMEVGKGGEKSAILEIKDEFGIDVYSIVNLEDIIEYLSENEVDGKVVLDDDKVNSIRHYLSLYGAKN